MSLTDRNFDDVMQEWNSTCYEYMMESFQNGCENVENGEISTLDLAVRFTKERAELQHLDTMRKEWLSENLESILNEAELHGKEGYRGYLFSETSIPKYDYSTSEEWVSLNKKIKDLEDLMKTAWKNTGKNIANATLDGEEIPLPIVKYPTPSLTAKKVKS